MEFSLISLIIFVIVSFLVLSILMYLINAKSKRINQYALALAKLKRSFNELDEQAKLIVQTDLELNKAQEESDKRLNSLEALHKISRLISTTLDENEIFHRLDRAFSTDIDFERAVVLVMDNKKQLQLQVKHGFSQDGAQFMLSQLQKDANLMQALMEGNTFSSANCPIQRKETIMQIFNTGHFVIAPILTQVGFIGIVFVGNQSNVSPITDGDEELIAILASQIGQTLENARLFEEVYRSSQALESKVTERTKQLQDALIEVQNISKTKSDFISAVSHELRTPLTSIKGYAAILMDGKLGDIPPQVKERLGKINTHSDNLVGLINDLLDISRIESGRVEMSFGRCRLDSLIENVHDLLTPQMREKNIHWETDLDKSMPDMYLDSSQIERVFINLVGNAIKFTPVKGTITISAHLKDNAMQVQVTDTGIGIPEEDIRRLFDEFYRVENEINQNVKGTGLGLPLAKKIVEAHGGEMWITSVVKEGTTFHFTLPVKTEEDILREREAREQNSG